MQNNVLNTLVQQLKWFLFYEQLQNNTQRNYFNFEEKIFFHMLAGRLIQYTERCDQQLKTEQVYRPHKLLTNPTQESFGVVWGDFSEAVSILCLRNMFYCRHTIKPRN